MKFEELEKAIEKAIEKYFEESYAEQSKECDEIMKAFVELCKLVVKDPVFVDHADWFYDLFTKKPIREKLSLCKYIVAGIDEEVSDFVDLVAEQKSLFQEKENLDKKDKNK